MQKIYLCRHAETEWNLSGQHTSYTDLSLTERGKQQASSLGKRIGKHKFSKVLTSPMKRAKQTCELAGFTSQFEVWDRLSEWNYGVYEGMRIDEIQKEIPDWTVFKYGARGGESVEQITKRAMGVIEELRKLDGEVIIFSHGHFLRVLAACWLGFKGKEGEIFVLGNASLSILGYERQIPVLVQWNDSSHL